MYFTAILLEDETLTSTEILVWYTLCSFARWKYQGKEPRLADNVFPSLDTIAERAHISKRSVQRSLKHLQELGYIEIISGGNDGRSNRYMLHNGHGDSQTGHGDSHSGHVTITPNRTINKGANADKKIKDPIDLEQMRRDVAALTERMKGR